VSHHVATYRRLLRAYPAAFRREFGDEMTQLFSEQLADAQASDAAFAVPRLWLATIIDLGLTAPVQRLRREEDVPRVVTVGTDFRGTEPRRPAPTPRLLLGLLPVWLFLFFSLTAPGYMDPLYLNPPGILGLPLGVVFVAIAMGWMGLGLLGLYRVASDGAALLVFMLFTAPATAAILLTPAMVVTIDGLVIQNPS
jgi:hypothetical protein